MIHSMYGVTAASGQLGKLVINELIKSIEPAQIVAFVRSPDKVEDLKEKGVQIRKADYTDKESYVNGLEGVDVLLLISGTDIGSRVEQHKNVIDAAQQNNVKKILYTSIQMNSPPDHPLFNDHAQTEQLIKDSGIKHVIFRNTFYAEVVLASLPLILEQGEYLFLDGKEGVPFISRKDIAKLISKVILDTEVSNEIFEVTGSKVVNNYDLVNIINNVYKTDVKAKGASEEEITQILKNQGLPDTAIYGRLGFEKIINAGFLNNISSDYEKIVNQPATSVIDLVKELKTK